MKVLCSLALARVGLIAVGAVALLSACDDPTSPAPDHQSAAALVSTASTPHTELRDLIESGPKSAVGGEKLNVELLRRFYARHGFAPVWTTRQAQANSLIECRVARRRSWPRP